uniref:Uncharacterized protein n=1 Tax=Populus trichocarpa TaxID=3694 RepID=A0A3N7ECL8_POPTR
MVVQQTYRDSLLSNSLLSSYHRNKLLCHEAVITINQHCHQPDFMEFLSLNTSLVQSSCSR